MRECGSGLVDRFGIGMTLELPNYRVVEKIGTGAQTTVYRARCMRSGKDYAIKVVKVRQPEDMKIVDLMRDEHVVGSAIDHPVIRKTYEFRPLRRLTRVHGALLFMEYVAGTPLSDRNLSMPLDETLRVFARVGEGLAAMHRAGFVHADLKPGNILVTADGEVKLIDFGQSSRLGEAKPRVQGTIDYMAPEQATQGRLDQRTDVFGLGATLHRVLTGKPVPTEMNKTVNPHSQRLLGKRREATPQMELSGMPTCVARFIESCCQTSMDARLSDMTAVIQTLELARSIVRQLPAGEDPSELDEHDLLDDEHGQELSEDELLDFLAETPDVETRRT